MESKAVHRALGRSRCIALACFGVVWFGARAAEAVCNVDGNVRTCSPNNGNGDGVVAVVGSYGESQWIGWTNALTGQCINWDQIGGSGFYNDTVVSGTVYDDVIKTSGIGEEVCGVPLDPPVAGFHTLKFEGWGGGYDYLLSYVDSFATTLDCSGADGCYFELWGGGSIVGSHGEDYAVKYGNDGMWGWNFFMNGSSDNMLNYTSDPPDMGDCGEGNLDNYDGPVPSSDFFNCEQ
jgi:hypothetical protein